MADGCIYVITHKPVDIELPRGYRKLFVGAQKLTNEEKVKLQEYMFDNTGDNISEKNSNYCELTGLYWIWKNQKDAFVGITHYRRFFEKSGKIVSMEAVEKNLQKVDVIVAKRQWVERNVRTHFEMFHSKKDLGLVKKIIEEKCPEYLESFEKVMSKCFLFSFNMMICKKEVFDAYCNWLFDILIECEKRVDITGYNTYQSRIYGFLSERLLMVYLMQHKLKIKEMKVLETEIDKSTKWASKKWEIITIVKNLFGNHGIRTMQYGK